MAGGSNPFLSGSIVSLSAFPAGVNSVFKGWHGGTNGLNSDCTVTMNSDMSISAEFEKVTISDTPIIAELISIGLKEVKSYQFASIFILKLHNKGDQQARVKVPLTSYKMQSGQTSEQTSWFAGRVNGSKGVTLSPDAFCEMGLVHSVKPALGDRLYVNVEKVKSSARTCFTFLCTHADEKFEMFQLVNSSLENQKEPVDAKETSPVMTSALKRIELLESTLAGVLLRLNAMQSDSRTSRNDASNYTAPAQTLPEVLAWVAENDRITVAELRARLLPLDLLPSAVINEINEKALDQMSELALEEVGDEIAVIKEILDEVLANWDAGKS